MMITLLAIATILLSIALILGHLRAIAHDTYDALSGCAQQAHVTGKLWPRLAFMALWAMIFSLSYV